MSSAKPRFPTRADVFSDRDDPEATNDEQLRLEQDVLSPLAHTGKLYAYQTTSPWVQIKSAA